MARRVQDVYEDGKRYRCDDRAERRIAPEDHHREPKNEGRCHGFGAEGNKNSEAGGDSLAAAKSEPDGKHVADHGEYCGGHHPADVAAGPTSGEPNGGVAFCGVEQAA